MAKKQLPAQEVRRIYAHFYYLYRRDGMKKKKRRSRMVRVNSRVLSKKQKSVVMLVLGKTKYRRIFK